MFGRLSEEADTKESGVGRTDPQDHVTQPRSESSVNRQSAAVELPEFVGAGRL